MLVALKDTSGGPVYVSPLWVRSVGYCGEEHVTEKGVGQHTHIIMTESGHGVHVEESPGEVAKKVREEIVRWCMLLGTCIDTRNAHTLERTLKAFIGQE